jgi:hypothetical protein
VALAGTAAGLLSALSPVAFLAAGGELGQVDEVDECGVVEGLDGLGVALRGLVAELDIGEAENLVRLVRGRQAELLGELGKTAVVVAALSAGVLDASDVGEAIALSQQTPVLPTDWRIPIALSLPAKPSEV